jgi:hypothetical protein
MSLKKSVVRKNQKTVVTKRLLTERIRDDNISNVAAKKRQENEP